MSSPSARCAAAMFRLFAMLLVSYLCAACTSGGGNAARTAPSPAADAELVAAPATEAHPGFASPLPPPSELVQPPAEPRAASYTEDDLFRPGKFFDPARPNSGVTEQGDAAVFEPNWQPGGGTDGLAYCMYSFPAWGFDRELELHYSFGTPPVDWSTIWFGMAEWSTDQWRWREADPSGNLATLLTLESFGIDGEVLIVIVCMADGDAPVLDWVYLGPPQVTAKIQTFIHSGVAPVNIKADASASTAGVGEITKYEWDWDGDGTFDEDTLDEASAKHTYTESGNYTPAVRVTSSLGVTDTAATTMSVTSPWVHTWGGTNAEYLSDVDAGSDNELYACGYSKSFSDNQSDDALLLKYDLDGNLQWARTSSHGLSQRFAGVEVAPDGSVYAAGRTYNSGESGNDLLLQHWDADGNLLWSKVWATDGSEEAEELSIQSDAIYIVGASEVNSGTQKSQVLVAKFTPNGEVVWARTIGWDYGDRGYGIQVVKPLLGDPEVHFTGYTTNDEAEKHALYGWLDDEGNLQECRGWFEFGESIGHDLVVRLYPERQVFIGGDTDSSDGGFHTLFVQYSASGSPLAKSWALEGLTGSSVEAMLDAPEGIVCAGWTTDNRAFLIHTDGTGALLAAKSYGTTGEHSRVFHGLTRFPGQGLLAVGTGLAATGAVPTDCPFNVRTLTGTWAALGFSAQSATGTVASLEVTTSEINTGVIDTGAGSDDGMVVAAPIP